MSEYVFLNDGLIPADEARISIHDTGLLHGVGLFETMRSYHGRVFRLADHLDRLFQSAEKLQIILTQSRQQIVEGIEALLKANQLADARLRLTATRGSIRRLTSDKPATSTLFVTAGAMETYPAELYRYGMMVVISSYKQNPDDPTVAHKSLNYFPRLLALQQAQQKKAGEALWFTTTNRLAEGCISNVFLVSQGKLLTPGLDTPVLPGIIRKLVLELARKNNIECEECILYVKDLLDAQEVFLTNSVMELMPVNRIEAHKVGADEPGPIYQKLHQLYREAVNDETK